MNILILGHKGQIGSAFQRYAFHEKIAGVRCLDIEGHGTQYMDLREPSDELEQLVFWADMVMFLAYDVGGAHYLKDAEHQYSYIEDNYKMMDNVFSTCKRANDTPVIFGSSQMATMTHSPYGVLKRLGEFMCKAVGGLSVRFWNVYGIETNPEKFHVITDFVLDAINKGEVTVRSTGKEERQFLYADDCAEALYAVCENYYELKDQLEQYGMDSVDISTGHWTTIAQIAFEIAEIAGNIPVNFGTDLRDYVDTQRDIHNEPNDMLAPYWQPKVTLTQGLQLIYDHHS